METIVIDGIRYSHVKGIKGSCEGCALAYLYCINKYNDSPCKEGGILKRHYKLPLIKVITK